MVTSAGGSNNMGQISIPPKRTGPGLKEALAVSLTKTWDVVVPSEHFPVLVFMQMGVPEMQF